ncbi:extracellular solute-binding protein [Kitasatospora cineracea]|uniref:ABC transporter substrate-binding protein n=1 Tax=Kitasatospora cineracea TaxID=88074 RepID=UPI0034248B66
MSRRTLALSGCVSLVVALAATGCGSGSGSAGSADGKVTLKVIGWKGGPSEPAKIKEINAAFEAAHPNIKIDYTYQPANDPYTQKLNAEFLGGTAQDVVMANSAGVARWGKSGYLLDLSDQPWAVDLAVPAAPLTQVDNKTVAQPSEMVGIGLFSNMEILNSAGITEAPATWQELLADLDTLKKAGKPGIALPDKEGWTVDAAINATAASQVFQKDPDWNRRLSDGKTTFAGDTGWKTSVQRLVDLGSKGYVDYKEQLGVSDFSQGPQDFKAGKSAFLLQGSWALADFAKDMPKLRFSPWPGGDDPAQPMATNAVGTMWTINARTKHQDAAKEYLKFWASADALNQYLTAEAAFSPFVSIPSPAVPDTDEYIKAVAAGHFFVLPENSWAGGASQTAMQNAVQALLLGQKSVDATLAAFDTAAKG